MEINVKMGDRIKLLPMPDEPEPLAAGSLGLVRGVSAFENWAQVQVDWDCGRRLSLCVPPDRFEVVV